MTRPEDIDDMLSELSTPGLGDDLAAQKKYIDDLINKGKKQAFQDIQATAGDKEEQDLHNLFNDLKAGSGMAGQKFDDIVSEMSETMSQASSSQRNFYKPQMKG